LAKIQLFTLEMDSRAKTKHVPNKRLPSHFFWCPLATVGHFNKDGKKLVTTENKTFLQSEI
jgi:hypothetical protein